MREAQITSLKGIFLLCGILLSLLAINLIHDRHVEDIDLSNQTDSLIKPATVTVLNDFMDVFLDSEEENIDKNIPKQLKSVKVLFKAESSDDAIKNKTIDFLPLLSDVPLRQGSFVGIINKGNSCYADSVLQMLFRIPLIRKIVSNLQIYYEIIKEKVDELEAQALNIAKDAEVDSDEIKSLDSQRKKLIDSVLVVEGLNHMFHQLQENSTGKPADFYFEKSMQCMPGIFFGFRQEDANEYYQVIMEELTDLLPTNQQHHLNIFYAWINFKKSIPGVEPEQTELSKRVEFAYSLSLPLKENLNQMLRFYFESETIEGVRFDDDTPGTLQSDLRLENLPEILPIQLIRFRSNGSKIHDPASIPYIIDVGKFLEDSNQEAFYVLKMYVHHHGNTVNSGHYYAYSHESDGKWHLLNDSQVTTLGSESPKDLSTSYIYFYERIHPDAPVPCMESLTVPELFLIKYNGFMSKELVEKYSPKISTPTPPVNPKKPHVTKKPALKPTVITPIRKIVKITRKNNCPKPEDQPFTPSDKPIIDQQIKDQETRTVNDKNKNKSQNNKDSIPPLTDSDETKLGTKKNNLTKYQEKRQKFIEWKLLKQERKQEKERMKEEALQKIQEQERKQKQKGNRKKSHKRR